MIRRVAILGGGPGGLMTAYQLQQHCSVPVDVTIYEAGGRLGGKVQTTHFKTAPVAYEAGAAELYDYSVQGPDPLRELVEDLGLAVQPMRGASVILNEQVLDDLEDVARVCGPATRRALQDFDERAKGWMGPEEYYDADWRELRDDPMSGKTFEDELNLVPDAAARHFLRTLVHSDLATEPHKTSAAYGLQNYLMNDDRYMRLYTIDGGIQQLVLRLADELEAHVRLREPVLRVETLADGRVRIVSRMLDAATGAPEHSDDFDYVVAALPNHYLPTITWKDDTLSQAIRRHYVRYDYPAHYLRVSVLFREVFWRDVLKDSYFMLDAFGGCCLYDESARNGCEDYGALGWLLAGDAALTYGNFSDEELVRQVLDSLPASLQGGQELFMEGRVHRWMGSVNGMPGGAVAASMDDRHMPDATRRNVLVVGDYLFDSTLNGVLDSADYVAKHLAERLQSDFYGAPAPAAATAAATIPAVSVGPVPVPLVAAAAPVVLV